MKVLLILMFMILSSYSWGTVVQKSVDCPDQFEARVKEIIEPIGAEDIFSKNKVLFENVQVLKGHVDEDIQLDILKNGPFKIEEQKDYKVQMRKGKLCWIEQI